MDNNFEIVRNMYDYKTGIHGLLTSVQHYDDGCYF